MPRVTEMDSTPNLPGPKLSLLSAMPLKSNSTLLMYLVAYKLSALLSTYLQAACETGKGGAICCTPPMRSDVPRGEPISPLTSGP